MNPDAHKFFNQSVEVQPMVVLTIIIKISLKEGLNQWGKKFERVDEVGDEATSSLEHSISKTSI